MVQSTMGTQVLDETDIVDIVKEHFYRYNQGFKNINIIVDYLFEKNKPRIGMEISLEPLNKKMPDSYIEKLYYNLLNTCKESVNVEVSILNKVYDLIKNDEISKDIFIALIKRIKGL